MVFVGGGGTAETGTGWCNAKNSNGASSLTLITRTEVEVVQTGRAQKRALAALEVTLGVRLKPAGGEESGKGQRG